MPGLPSQPAHTDVYAAMTAYSLGAESGATTTPVLSADRAGYEPLHAQAIWAFRIGSVLPLAAAGLALALGLLIAGQRLGFGLAPGLLGMVVLPLLALRLGWRLAQRRWAAVALKLDRHGLVLRRGVWWQSELRLLRSRIQHSDLSRGPLERRFGLATLELHTAGSEQPAVKISGLGAERAAALRDDLLSGHDDRL